MCKYEINTHIFAMSNFFKNLIMEQKNYNSDERSLLIKILELVEAIQKSKTPTLVFGIKGLAKLLNISVPKAQALKNSGSIDVALYQIGRKVAFDSDKVLEILKVIPDDDDLSAEVIE